MNEPMTLDELAADLFKAGTQPTAVSIPQWLYDRLAKKQKRRLQRIKRKTRMRRKKRRGFA